MKIRYRINLFYCTVLLILAVHFSCNPPQKTAAGAPTAEVEIIILQINDVYEIAPLEGGKTAGMARVATVYKRLKAENNNTVAVVAGDFLSPSFFNFLTYNGEKIKGRQMVEVMNTAGISLVTFGNHEFDLKQSELQQRMNESDFMWMSSNVKEIKDGVVGPFERMKDSGYYAIPETIIIDAVDSAGNLARLGILAVTLPFNQQEYVHYEDVLPSAKAAYDTLEKKTNLIVALTHLNIEQDIELARQLPQLKLIMGGHDHEHMYIMEGITPITKADANAKSVYIHRITFDPITKRSTVNSELKFITDSIPEDPQTAKVVQRWMKIAEESFEKGGFNKNEVIGYTEKPLDGKEANIRNHPTNLGSKIAEAIAQAAIKTDLAILNAGSIRLDDQLQGAITQYDILRTLPFGGTIVEVEMKGSLLIKILNAGFANKGTGGFLHWHNIRSDTRMDQWLVNGEPVAPQKNYIVAMPEFLLTGGESNMGFLNRENPEIVNIYEPKKDDTDDLRADIRKAVIEYFRKS